MQERSITNSEAKRVISEAIGRVRSMAELYDKMLLSDNYRQIPAARYLSDLTRSIVALFADKTEIDIVECFDDFLLTPKKAFLVGIILNELLTNALKYAFNGRRSGKITIVSKKVSDRIILNVRDNGDGLPWAFDVDASKGFGINLVKMLSQQLEGRFEMENDNGTVSTLEFRA
jgi:two-component sensor histidine kinase